MAWLISSRRKNRHTGHAETYWSLQWRDEATGRKRTRAIGFCAKSEASRALKVFEGKTAAGDPVEPTPSARSCSAPEPRTPTLAEYLRGVYLPIVHRDKSPATYQETSRAVARLTEGLGGLRLDEVGFLDVEHYVTVRRKAGRKTRTVALELIRLRAALAHAKKAGLIEVLPELPRVQITDRTPHRYLTPTESVRLLDALRPLDVQPHQVTRGAPPVCRDPLSYLVILMALNTGARKRELLTRCWEDVRWDEGPLGSLVIDARAEVDFQVKTRWARVIPLTPELRMELERAHAVAGRPVSGWIFPSPKDPAVPRDDFKTALHQACRRAGLEQIHPHGLRHTWASRLAMAGVDRWTLMHLGGWKSGRMLDEIYAHVSPQHAADVMTRSGLGSSADALARSDSRPSEDSERDEVAPQDEPAVPDGVSVWT